jgi:hypothetical protein
MLYLKMSTVFLDTLRNLAISFVDMPSLIKLATWISLGVSFETVDFRWVKNSDIML